MESDLRAELKREHFDIRLVHGGQYAPQSNYEFLANRRGSIPLACELDWNIMWAAEKGRITGVAGTYYAICL